jgi:hypothetical protein
MPGLDPGIHPLCELHLAKEMDCRVKPGNDGAARVDGALMS